MTRSEYIAFLEESGVKLEVNLDRLRVSPANRVGPGTLEVLKLYKSEIIAAIRDRIPASTSTDLSNSADSRETVDAKSVICPRCGSDRFVDVKIHDGKSVRRDCAKCRRFIDFPFWYGARIGGSHSGARRTLKPPAERRDQVFSVKLTADEKRLLHATDARTWARDVLLRSARKRG